MDLTSLVQELGIEKLPKEQQAVIMNEIIATIHTRVGARLAKLLTLEQQKHVGEVIKKHGEQAGIDALEEVYPDYKKLYQEEVDLVKEDLKAIIPKG
jgi:hypothetical protein